MPTTIKLAAGALICIGSLSALGVAVAGVNDRARIGLHLQSPPQGKATICGQAEKKPCDDSQVSLATHGNLLADYYCYVLVLDGSDDVAGVSFGIEYGTHFKPVTWTLCADLELRSGSPSPTWPSSGSGNVVTWTTPTNCQSTPATGDLDGGITAVVGALYLYAYEADYLKITKNQTVAVPTLSVANCGSGTDEVRFPQGAGKVGFGTEQGFDPCKGPFVPFSEIQNLTSQELASVLVKLSIVGGYRSAPHQVLLGPSAIEDVPLMEQYRRVGYWYFPSEEESEFSGGTHPRLSLATSEMESIVDVIAGLPAVADGNVDADGELSIALFVTGVQPVKVFESIVNQTNGALFFSGVLDALANSEVEASLKSMMCQVDMIGSTVPIDVTPNFDVEISGFREDHTKDSFVGTVRITNTSTQTFSIPVTLLLREGADAQMLNAHGSTCRYGGPAYYVLDVGISFEPDETVEQMIEFYDTGAPKVTFSPQILSGPGMR